MLTRLTVYLPEELDHAMRIDAHNKGQKLSTWVERAIAGALADDTPAPKLAEKKPA